MDFYTNFDTSKREVKSHAVWMAISFLFGAGISTKYHSDQMKDSISEAKKQQPQIVEIKKKEVKKEKEVKEHIFEQESVENIHKDILNVEKNSKPFPKQKRKEPQNKMKDEVKLEIPIVVEEKKEPEEISFKNIKTKEKDIENLNTSPVLKRYKQIEENLK